MPQFIYKTFKLTFWALVPFLFVSSGVDSTYFNETILLDGAYELKTSGDFEKQLIGVVVFETYMETSVSGKKFSTLKLSFSSEEDAPLHTMEFFISQPKGEHVVSAGSYTIIPKVDGFLKCFNGAFGFANLLDLSEVPFFTRKGKIVIGYVDKHTIRGNVSANLYDPNGKRIFVSGRFSAVKKN